MLNTDYSNAWIDRYLRNELTADDEARFENALLESPHLQDQLEASLALRRMLELEARGVEPEQVPSLPGFRSPWFTMALSASLILAVLSGVMYWNVSHDVADLQTGSWELGQPHAHEVIVPLDIMRSAGEEVPEAIIHRPAGHAYIALDIELSEVAISADAIQIAFRDAQGNELATWSPGSIENGRVKVPFDAKYLPAGRVWLEISDPGGNLLDRRLLEFR